MDTNWGEKGVQNVEFLLLVVGLIVGLLVVGLIVGLMVVELIVGLMVVGLIVGLMVVGLIVVFNCSGLVSDVVTSISSEGIIHNVSVVGGTPRRPERPTGAQDGHPGRLLFLLRRGQVCRILRPGIHRRGQPAGIPALRSGGDLGTAQEAVSAASLAQRDHQVGQSDGLERCGTHPKGRWFESRGRGD